MWLLFCLRLNLLSLFSYVRFNYRSTHHLTTNGFFEFLNWFDERAWYPLGRIVGGTVSFPQNVCACLSFKGRLLFSWVLLELMDKHVHSFMCVYTREERYLNYSWITELNPPNLCYRKMYRILFKHEALRALEIKHVQGELTSLI